MNTCLLTYNGLRRHIFTNQASLHLKITWEHGMRNKSHPKYIEAAKIKQVYTFDCVQCKQRTQTADCNHMAHNSPVYHFNYGSIFFEPAEHTLLFMNLNLQDMLIRAAFVSVNSGKSQLNEDDWLVSCSGS